MHTRSVGEQDGTNVENVVGESDPILKCEENVAGEIDPNFKCEENVAGEIDPNFKCEICDVQCRTLFVLETHLNGKKHASRKRALEGNALSTAKGDPNFKCEICDIQFTSAITFETHVNGKKHNSRKRAFDEGNALSTAKNGEANGDPNLKCEICDIQFMSSSNLEIHLNGKKHVSRKRASDASIVLPAAKKVKEGSDSSLKCEICDVQFTSTRGMEEHFNGKKHTSRKRALGEDNAVPTTNKAKEGSKKSKIKDEIKSDSFKCEDCNIELSTADMAVQHFKGKKHKSQIIKSMQAKLTQNKSKTGWKGRGAANGKTWSPMNYASENARLVKNMQSLKPYGNGMLSNYFTKASGQQNERSQPPHAQRLEVGYRSIQHMQNSRIAECRIAAKDRVYERDFEENIQSMLLNHNDYPDNGSSNNGPAYGYRGVGNDNNPNNEYNRDERGRNYHQTSKDYYREDGRDSDVNNLHEE